jgi:hypothetical protein
MLRPKFSIAIIVALTTALAMAALVYRHRVQVQWLECTLIALLSTGFRPPMQVNLILLSLSCSTGISSLFLPSD